MESHPAWVCGLKRMNTQKLSNVPLVTPCVGVWIETVRVLLISLGLPSHPAWVCGLKLVILISMSNLILSHPAWVCGLKLPLWLVLSRLLQVTPCVGVWIET